jgi:hypothetical protein
MFGIWFGRSLGSAWVVSVGFGVGVGLAARLGSALVVSVGFGVVVGSEVVSIVVLLVGFLSAVPLFP